MSLIFAATPSNANLYSFGKCRFLHLESAESTYEWMNALKFSSSSENEHCYNSTLASLIYFLAILRKFVLANENPEMVHSELWRKWGDQKQENILYGKHQEHPLAVLFLRVTKETSFVISQIWSIPLFHHRLVPYPIKTIIFVNRCYIKAFKKIT